MASKARHLHNGAIHQLISVDRLFDAAFGPSAALYRRESLMGWRPVSAAGGGTHSDHGEACPPSAEKKPPVQPPGIHIHETPEKIVVEVELPEIKADSLYLEIAGDLLIVRGERIIESQKTHKGQGKNSKGPLVHRYVQLPVIARPGEVRARLEGNIVRINISKQPKAG